MTDRPESSHSHKWQDIGRNPDWTLNLGIFKLGYDGAMNQRCVTCGETRQVRK